MTVCSWCGAIIERPVAALPVQAVTHGICRECLSRELAKLRPTVAPAPQVSDRGQTPIAQ
jgi:DNA-directed RNA polymerase subunit RPC12/RpoP